MESVYDRIREYRKQSLESSGKEVERFEKLILKGRVPHKCLECIRSGLRFCCFWNDGFNCEKHDQKMMYETIERLL